MNSSMSIARIFGERKRGGRTKFELSRLGRIVVLSLTTNSEHASLSERTKRAEIWPCVAAPREPGDTPRTPRKRG